MMDDNRYQTAEDGLADTVKPRLESAGADCTRISIIDESEKSVSMTDDRLEQAIRKENAGLLILDPIQAYLGCGTDMNRANEAREMTKKLGSIAERTGCAIVLIGHMNKGSGAKAAYRGMGSIDFYAVARSVLLVGRIEGQPNMRAIVQIKNNLSAFGHAVPRKEKQEKVVSDNIYGDDIEYAGERAYSSKLKSTVNMEEVVAEINVKDKSFYSYADYALSSVEEKLRMAVIDGNDGVMAVYEKLNSFFKQIGHKVDFDELYVEAKRLATVVRKNVVVDKADKIARNLSECGPYKYLKTSVKADAFKFDVSDAGGNLKLFMSVLDKLGVKLDGNQLYEEYQKIYDETVSRNEMHEKEQDKQWNKGRGR